MKSVTICGLLTILYSFRCAVAANDEDHDHAHDHGEHGSGFEWAGIFETPEANYLWTAQKVNGDYADPAMKLVALPATTVSQQALHDMETQGKEAMELICTPVQAGSTITPAASTCYELQFQATAWQSLFNVDASAVAGIAFFAQHL
ncbi:nipblb [Symbiodinium pilosum]|uniref:Nipblb protein n=1 Tax=Symbiodinium pilosum TaxID=2952 RepID=A0A812T368_SYMPI|nr:nipblb [Symbiodinium pilosum]